MADPEAPVDTAMAEDTPVDVEMGGEEVIDVDAKPTATAEEGGPADNDGDAMPFQEEEAKQEPARVTFIDYLKSPFVELAVSQGNSSEVLHAHQALLVKSPFFAEACAQLGNKRRIEMNEDLAAVGAFLEFLYTGEYYPKRTGERVLENASTTGLDETGDELLKHARVYTLAEKLGMDNLKSLAHSKIHCVNATARGEIAYARYVYANTSKEDVTIRKPVAAFWAQRSHVLRSEAGDEFRDMCLEYPQFGFDVLTRVLDEKMRREQSERPGPPLSSRKRARHSGVAT